MRKLSINRLKPGMILAKKIYSPNGHVLLVEGTELNDNYLMRIQALGYSSVFIQDLFSMEHTQPQLIQENQWMTSLTNIKKTFERAIATGKLDTAVVKSIVNTFSDEIIRNRSYVFEYPDIRPYEAYLFGHAMNVCLLSLRIGVSMGYNEFQIRDLGIGALLHDIGELFINQAVLEKAGKLTPEEFGEVKKHTAEGFRIMREHSDINLLSSHVSFQHHERVDGSGYPRGLKNNEICEYARIVAIADMFDALTSERRHRKAFTLNEAMTQMNAMAGTILDAELMKIFNRYVAAFPVGCLVALNTGEIAVVMKNNIVDRNRPMVKIMMDRAGTILKEGQQIDLNTERAINIVKEIDDDGFILRLNNIFA